MPVPSPASSAKAIPYPITIAGKKVEGFILTQPNADSTWIANYGKSTSPYTGFANFSSTVDKNGNVTKWQEASPGSIASLAKLTGLKEADIKRDLANNKTLIAGLDQQRLNQLGGAAGAAKLNPKIPGSTNVAPTQGTPADKPTDGGEAEQKSPITQENLREGVEIGKFRNRYDSLGKSMQYPENMQSKQDCIKFEMIRYIPKKFNTDVKSIGDMFIEDDSYLKGTEKKLLGNVILPIQSPISDSNTTNWGESPMQSLEALAAGGAMGLITSGKDGKSLTDIANEIQAATPALKALIASTLSEKAASSVNSNLFTRLTGGILNPNMELLFTGPQLRSFSFSFVMSARDDREAEMIRSIIRFFKQGMSVKRGKTNLFLLTPNVFQISYLYRGGENAVLHPWINRIKTCALQNCAVNYTPSGSYATYNDGSMTSYEMTLSFSELTPIYDDDYSGKDFEGDINALPTAHIGY